MCAPFVCAKILRKYVLAHFSDEKQDDVAYIKHITSIYAHVCVCEGEGRNGEAGRLCNEYQAFKASHMSQHRFLLYTHTHTHWNICIA